MAVKELKTIIKLHRDSELNWNKISASFSPLLGEVCLIDTADKGLRAKVGDGSTLLKDLPYTDDNLYKEIDGVVLSGYYLNGKFYTDSTYTVEFIKNINRIYIDKNSNVIYHYDGEKFISINETLPTASDVVPGIMKLYGVPGQNEDGTMTQKSITNGIKEIKLALDPNQEECLVLELPW